MRANLESSGGFVLSEALMLALATTLGKQSAHTLVYDLAMAAHADGRSLKQAVLEDPIIQQQLAPEAIQGLFDYQRHTGCCGEMVDQVLAELERPYTP
jgi:adenylosuccinate lyase